MSHVASPVDYVEEPHSARVDLLGMTLLIGDGPFASLRAILVLKRMHIMAPTVRRMRP
jgi:hypothetical protein